MQATINGTELVFDQVGDGEPVLLIHGLGGTANFYWPLVSALNERATLIVPDQPGAGRSGPAGEASIDALAATMLALLDTLSLGKVQVVAHSMGTIVAQYMAAAAPDRIERMVLLGPLAEPPAPARDALRDRAAAARRDGMAGIADAISTGALSAATKDRHGNAQGFVREMLLRQRADGYAQNCEALAGATRAPADAIRCPASLITGSDDAVAPPDAVMRLGEELPDASVTVLDGCGHWTVTERPDAVRPLVEQFLRLS